MVRSAALFLLLAAGACSAPSPTTNDSRPAAEEVQASAEPVARQDSKPAPGENRAAETPVPENAEDVAGEVAVNLRKGVYVAAGTDCRSPSNAGFRVWDGRGLSGSATRDCRLSATGRDGEDIGVEQSCVDTYSGTRSTSRFSLRISDDRHFTLAGEGRGQAFRLCPAEQVPDWLKEAKPVN